MSHVLDKAMESVFGYITVLPGAFSAYRWEAIRNEPLHKYFKTEEVAVSKISAFEANMFLAEDRVCCVVSPVEVTRKLISRTAPRRCYVWRCLPRRTGFGRCTTWLGQLRIPTFLRISFRSSSKCVMRGAAVFCVFVCAVALTPLWKTQRRRWLNGAFFALMYFMLRYTGVIAHTDHSILRKIAFTFQFFYLVMLVVLNWLVRCWPPPETLRHHRAHTNCVCPQSPGAVYLSFFVIFNKTLEDFQLGQAFLFIFSLTYIFSFIIVVLAAIGSEIKSVYVPRSLSRVV